MLYCRNVLVVGMVALFAVFMSGCQEAPGQESAPTRLYLVSPVEGSVLTAPEGLLKVTFMGAINASNFRLALNGVDITARMTVTPYYAAVLMTDVDGLLLPGDNIVTGTMVNNSSFQQDFHFDFDNIAPYIEVTSQSATPPGAGNSFQISGKIHDPSLVESLYITNSDGSIITVALDANEPAGAQTFTVALTYPDYSSSTLVNAAQFSYTATDIHGQTRTENLVIPEATFAPLGAGQINASLFDHAEQLANAFMRSLNTNLALQDYLVTDVPTNSSSAEASVGDDWVVPTPASFLSGMPLYTLEARGTEFCPADVFSSAIDYCVIYIRDIRPINPAVGIDYSSYSSMNDNNDNPQLWLDLWMESLGVDIEVAGVESNVLSSTGYTYKGGFKTSFALTNFKFRSTVDIYPQSDKLIGMSRDNGFKLLMTQLFQQPHMYGSSCNICSVDIGLAELAYNIRLLRADDGRSLGDVIVDGIEEGLTDMVGGSLDSLLNTISGSSTSEVFVDNSATTSPNRQVINTVSADDVEPVTILKPLDPYGAFFSLKGGFQAGITNAVPGLGSLFAHDDSYSNIVNKVFPGTLNNQQVDVAFSISSNAINQYLAANYQTGMFSEETVTLADDEVAQLAQWLDTAVGNNVVLKFDTGMAPKVKFTPAQAAGPNVSFNLFGFEFGTDNQAVEPAIDVEVPNLTITIRDEDAAQDLLVANIDLSAGAVLSHSVSGAKAFVTPRDTFAKVVVNSVSTAALVSPYDLVLTTFYPALVGDILTSTINNYADNHPNLLMPSARRYNLTTELGDFVVGGLTFTYSNFLGSELPREYGILPRWFGIEPSGGFLTIGGDLVSVKLPVATGCEDDPATPETTDFVPSDDRYLWSVCLYR